MRSLKQSQSVQVAGVRLAVTGQAALLAGLDNRLSVLFLRIRKPVGDLPHVRLRAWPK